MKPHPRLTTLRWLLLTGVCLGLLVLMQAPASQVRASRAAAPLALVNAASYAESVAPGSIAALFSSNMTAQAGEAAGTLPLPNTLAGLTVKVNGIVSPLFYASAGQVNLQVPHGVPTGVAGVEVFVAGATTPVSTGTVNVFDAAPGVFTVNQLGTAQAAAINSDYSINADFDRFPGSHPEAGGTWVIVYATGIGRTSPLVADGQVAPGGPLAIADGTTTVSVGGLQAQVLYSGLAPGFVGLWQLNVLLPASLATNLSTSVGIELKAKQSQPTTIAVANKNDLTTVSGNVVNALTGSPIASADVAIQPVPAGALRHAFTNAQGKYQMVLLGPSNLSLSASAAGFITASNTASIEGGTQTALPPIALTVPLAAGQFRVVVAWQSALDLDAHLTGPATAGRFHVWWNGETDLRVPATAQFDRDDLTGLGPETITFTPQPGGIYRFSVQNYSNRDISGSMGFAKAQVRVSVYSGSQQVAVLSPPSGGGTLWKVFELNNGQLAVVNQLSDEPDPSNIKTLF